MTSSNILIEALKGFEGCKLVAYKPVNTERYFTIGYGHYGQDVKQGMKITASKAEELLRQDLQKFERAINALNVCKTQGQFDALVDFAYNCGLANLNLSTLLKYIRAGRKPEEIQAQFRRWNKSGKKVLPGLVKRREWEAQRWVQ